MNKLLKLMVAVVLLSTLSACAHRYGYYSHYPNSGYYGGGYPYYGGGGYYGNYGYYGRDYNYRKYDRGYGDRDDRYRDRDYGQRGERQRDFPREGRTRSEHGNFERTPFGDGSKYRSDQPWQTRNQNGNDHYGDVRGNVSRGNGGDGREHNRHHFGDHRRHRGD